jgi:sortase A
VLPSVSRRLIGKAPRWLLAVQLMAVVGTVAIGARPAARVVRHHWRQWQSAAAWEAALREPETGQPGEAAGFLRAPAAGLAQLVVRGADKARLHQAACLEIRGGLSVVLGHRDRHFGRLERLMEGDMVQWQTRGGAEGETADHPYRVMGTQVLTPADLETLLNRPPAGAQAALVTCHPFRYIGPAPNRYVVWLAADAKAATSP